MLMDPALKSITDRIDGEIGNITGVACLDKISKIQPIHELDENKYCILWLKCNIS